MTSFKPKRFGPTQPTIQDTSTAEVTVGGTYDGSQGDDTLTFQIKKQGNVSSEVVQVEVFDSSGQKIDQVRIARNAPPGEEYLLKNGLTISFSAGALERNARHGNNSSAPSQSRCTSPPITAPTKSMTIQIASAAKAHPVTRPIAHVLFHDQLPTDVRHNAKINREALAVWARGKIR